MTTTEQSTREPVPAYERFVDDSTKENYRDMARDIAESEGSSPSAALAKLAKGFRTQHENDPAAGWGHLADWAESEKDPGDGAAANLAEVEKAIAVESARRDPRAALTSAPEAVEAAEKEVARRNTRRRRDLGVDVVPNAGPAEGVKAPKSGGAAK